MQSRSGYKNAKKGQKKTPTEPFYGFCWVPIGDLAGNRTRDCAVRGRRLNRLTTRPFLLFDSLAGNTSRATPARAFIFYLRSDYTIIAIFLQSFLRIGSKKILFFRFLRKEKTSACAAYRKRLTRSSQVGGTRTRIGLSAEADLAYRVRRALPK